MSPKHKSIRHQSIKVFDHERNLLETMYLKRRIPIEQYETRTADRESLTEDWNKLTGRSDTGNELVHYMRTRRKRGLWPRLAGTALPVQPAPEFSADETEALVAIYTEDVAAMGVGSDALGYEDETKALIAKEFTARTGRIIPADDLVTKLTALRKRGRLPPVVEIPIESEREDVGFNDADRIRKAK